MVTKSNLKKQKYSFCCREPPDVNFIIANGRSNNKKKI